MERFIGKLTFLNSPDVSSFKIQYGEIYSNADAINPTKRV